MSQYAHSSSVDERLEAALLDEELGLDGRLAPHPPFEFPSSQDIADDFEEFFEKPLDESELADARKRAARGNRARSKDNRPAFVTPSPTQHRLRAKLQVKPVRTVVLRQGVKNANHSDLVGAATADLKPTIRVQVLAAVG